MNEYEYAEKYLTEVKELLISKNKNYGNSALCPIKIFSTADSFEQIKVRIDDKLCRLANKAVITDTEDTLKDLIGYLFLLDMALSNRKSSSSFDKLLENTFNKFKEMMSKYNKEDYNNVYLRIAFPSLSSDNADMLMIIKISVMYHLTLITKDAYDDYWYRELLKDFILMDYYDKKLKGELNR